MRRICRFCRLAERWRKRNVEWIVCQECRRQLRNGTMGPDVRARVRGRV